MPRIISTPPMLAPPLSGEALHLQTAAMNRTRKPCQPQYAHQHYNVI